MNLLKDVGVLLYFFVCLFVCSDHLFMQKLCCCNVNEYYEFVTNMNVVILIEVCVVLLETVKQSS